MSGAPLKIRRGCRKDFDAVMALLRAAGLPTPPVERQALRRFRNIAADLGSDFYVAELERAVVGMVHLRYTRDLAAGQRARIEQLVVQPHPEAPGIGRALLEFAAARARRRSCESLSCVSAAVATERRQLFEESGMTANGTDYRVRLRG